MVEIIYFPKKCLECGSVMVAIKKMSGSTYLDCPNPKCHVSTDYEGDGYDGYFKDYKW